MPAPSAGGLSAAGLINLWMSLECSGRGRDIFGIADGFPIFRHIANLGVRQNLRGTHDIHTLIIGERFTGIAELAATLAFARAVSLFFAASAINRANKVSHNNGLQVGATDMGDVEHRESGGNDWEAEKSRLEAKKLEIETERYKDRVELGDRKLRADLNNWYFQVLLSTLAAIATVFSFFLGKHYERTSDTHKQNLEMAKQRDQEANEAITKYLALMTSTDANQRAIAASALIRYVQTSARQDDRQDEPESHGTSFAPSRMLRWLGMDDSDSDLDVYYANRTQERTNEIMRAVSVDTLFESDPRVLEALSDLLVARPKQSFPYTVALNRKAGLQLSRRAAEYVAWSFHDPQSFVPLGCQSDDENPHNTTNRQEVEARLNDLKVLGARIQFPLEGGVADGMQLFPTFQILPLLSTKRLNKIFQLECRAIVDRSVLLTQTQRTNEMSKSRDEIVQAARVMSVASLTLNLILRRLSEQVAGRDASETYLANGTLDKINLSGLNLGGSYIAGIASDFVCERCDFTNGELSQFHLSAPCNMTGANFNGVSAEVLKSLNLASCQH